MSYPARVTVVEVGPRDGLQNEPGVVPTEVKTALIARLAAAGLRVIEAAAFVSPRWVPQMADGAAVLAGLPTGPAVRYPVLVPNLQGFERALAAGAREVAVFPAASEAFSRRNLNCSIAESLSRVAAVTAAAERESIPVRGYISCALACPFEGVIAPAAVAELARALLDLGCAEISLGDTLGVGTPAAVRRLLDALLPGIPANRLAGHFHDTYGMAIANICTALEYGIATFDSSIAGLGGCPYAPGASGNVATEDVVYLLNGLGIETGIDLDRLVDAADYINGVLGRPGASRAGRALRSRSATAATAAAGPAGL